MPQPTPPPILKEFGVTKEKLNPLCFWFFDARWYQQSPYPEIS